MNADPIRRSAAAELEIRAREQRRLLAPKYDWYGGPCPCGLPLGECREHPRARHAQRPPDGDWDVWLFEGGRGVGKTRSGAEFVRHKVEAGAWMNVALINETVKDVRDVQIEGPGGLLDISPPWFKPVYEPSKARVTWPNGAIATIYSAEQPGLLRGPNFHGAWPDELPKWRRAQQETWDMLQFGMRLGDHPQIVVTTTPRPTPTYKSIRSHARTVVTRGRTFDNAAHLAPSFLARVREQYGGTRLGRQELDAELLEDTPGALWTLDLIEAGRLDRVPPGVDLVRVVVGVDPSAGSGDPESAAECGIVVAAEGSDGHGYVLEDRSLKGTPKEWGNAAIGAYRRHRADKVAAEVNTGGDMVEYVLRSIDPNVSFKKLWASRGKVTRAEPVASLYEQYRIHHVGTFLELESQLCSWVPGEKSPDRLDALAWTCTELMLEGCGSESSFALAGSRSAYPSL